MAAGREQTAASRAAASGLVAAYPLRTRVAWAVAVVLIGVFIAGFWNYQTVDGFGRGVVAGNTIGDTATLAGTYASNGAAFGLIFAAVAGLAGDLHRLQLHRVRDAAWPGLRDRQGLLTHQRHPRAGRLRRRGDPRRRLYGLYVGSLGTEGAQSFNERGARIAQAETVSTSLGALMLLWAALSFGFLDRFIRSIPAEIRAFFSAPLTRAGIMGLMVGTFAVGRPYLVFRDLLAYAATSQSPLYGALIMSIQGLGQVAVMVLLFLALVYLLRDRLTRWVTEQPQQSAFVTGVALFIGGASFVYYWGLAFWLGIAARGSPPIRPDARRPLRRADRSGGMFPGKGGKRSMCLRRSRYSERGSRGRVAKAASSRGALATFWQVGSCRSPAGLVDTRHPLEPRTCFGPRPRSLPSPDVTGCSLRQRRDCAHPCRWHPAQGARRW